MGYCARSLRCSCTSNHSLGAHLHALDASSLRPRRRFVPERASARSTAGRLWPPRCSPQGGVSSLRGSRGMEGGEAASGSGSGGVSGNCGDWGGGGGAGYVAITQVFEPQPGTLVQLAWSHWECSMLDLLATGQQLPLLCLLGFHVTGLHSMSAGQRGHEEHSSWRAEAAPCAVALTQGMQLGRQMARHWCTLIRQFAGNWPENSVLCACCTCLRAAC